MAALIVTPFLGILMVLALCQIKSGKSRFGVTPAPLVRLGAGFGLAFFVFAAVYIWWDTIAGSH